MVSKKKAAKKDAGTDEALSEEQVAKIVATGTSDLIMPFDEEPEETVKDVVEETPQVTDLEEVTDLEVHIVDETPKLLKLLSEAPPVPFIRTVEEAVAFVDKYAVWMRNVKAATG